MNSSFEPTWASLMEQCLSSATQSPAASLWADRNTFPGVHLDRPSGGAHVRLCQSRGDAAQSHGPWGERSWPGGKCGQFLWYFSKRENGQHTETKKIDLHLHLYKPVEEVMTMFLSQVRDWNEELQGCRELARNTIQERLHRERSIFKVRELTDIKNVEFMPLCTCSAQTVLLRSVKVMLSS